MQTTSRYLASVALCGAVALAACGGSDVSPVASTTAITTDGGSVTSSGNGPGTAPNPGPAAGTGTCTSDCNGTGAGNGSGPGPANGGGTGNGPGPGPSGGFCGNACTGPVGPDPADIATLLVEALQEEYKAENLYRSVLVTLGPDTPPFVTIAESEARHVEALRSLFTRRQMAPPASVWAPSSFPPLASVSLACAAGVEAETADAAFYDKYLPRTDLPQDVRNVFTSLQRASLENHLPAFERCR